MISAHPGGERLKKYELYVQSEKEKTEESSRFSKKTGQQGRQEGFKQAETKRPLEA